jgi:hypothetical protein
MWPNSDKSFDLEKMVPLDSTYVYETTDGKMTTIFATSARTRRDLTDGKSKLYYPNHQSQRLRDLENEEGSFGHGWDLYPTVIACFFLN